MLIVACFTLSTAIWVVTAYKVGYQRGRSNTLEWVNSLFPFHPSDDEEMK